MNVTGQEFLLNNADGKSAIDSLLRYSMNLPVTTAVVGMPRPELPDHNIKIARAFAPLPEGDMEHLGRTLQAPREPLEHKLTGHCDGPTGTPRLFWV